jgi:hypothetical protein
MALEGDGHGGNEDERTARGDEGTHPVSVEGVEGADGALGDAVGVEAEQGAVDIEEGRFYLSLFTFHFSFFFFVFAIW